MGGVKLKRINLNCTCRLYIFYVKMNSRSLITVAIFGLLLNFAAADDEEGGTASSGKEKEARLLVGKHIQNKYLVEGMDLVVKYNLFNIGDAAAVDITLTEGGFGTDDFDVVGGQSAVKFDRLAAGANTTHALVLRPT